MRILVQRVKYGKVTVKGIVSAEIGDGLVVFVGIGQQDTKDQAAFLAKKIANLRIFEDEDGKMNRSLLETGGEAMVVSQFTLYADTQKGRRPSYVEAALPETARPLVDLFAQYLRELGIRTGEGIFGAEMMVEIHNDGPVTIWLEK